MYVAHGFYFYFYTGTSNIMLVKYRIRRKKNNYCDYNPTIHYRLHSVNCIAFSKIAENNYDLDGTNVYTIVG